MDQTPKRPEEPFEVHSFAVMQAEESFSIDNLQQEEKEIVRTIAEKINLSDTHSILSYGIAAQTQIADFSDAVLQKVRTKDLGEMGGILTQLVAEIKKMDTSSEKKEGLFGLFHSTRNRFKKMSIRFAAVEKNIEEIVRTMETHRRNLLRDVAMFDKMFENNQAYFKELNYYILAGKEKLKELNNAILPEMQEQAALSGDQMEVQKYHDMADLVNRFDKKINDLMVSRAIALQMAPQIRLIQNNNLQLVDKIQSSLLNSIPIWKNQMVIALGLVNAKEALQAQQDVDKMTNEMLLKNSALLKESAVEIAKETETSIVSLETIQATNENLIQTVREVLEIHKKGREERENTEKQLLAFERDLKNALRSSE